MTGRTITMRCCAALRRFLLLTISGLRRSLILSHSATMCIAALLARWSGRGRIIETHSPPAGSPHYDLPTFRKSTKSVSGANSTSRTPSVRHCDQRPVQRLGCRRLLNFCEIQIVRSELASANSEPDHHGQHCPLATRCSIAVHSGRPGSWLRSSFWRRARPRPVR
jgi:hypothetical protein